MEFHSRIFFFLFLEKDLFMCFYIFFWHIIANYSFYLFNKLERKASLRVAGDPRLRYASDIKDIPVNLELCFIIYFRCTPWVTFWEFIVGF